MIEIDSKNLEKKNREIVREIVTDIEKLIQKFLHPLYIFSGNSQLLYQIGILLQKTIKPEMAVISDAKELGEELKVRLLGIKDNLSGIDEDAFTDKLELSQVRDLEKELTKMINALDHSLQTDTSPALLEIKIRDTALWILEELNRVNYFGESKLKSLILGDFIEFIQGILFKHLIRGAKIMKGETQILEREVEALRTYMGLQKQRRYLFKRDDIEKILKENLELFEPVFAEKNIEVSYRSRGNLTAEISKTDIDRVICNLFHYVI